VGLAEVGLAIGIFRLGGGRRGRRCQESHRECRGRDKTQSKTHRGYSTEVACDQHGRDPHRDSFPRAFDFSASVYRERAGFASPALPPTVIGTKNAASTAAATKIRIAAGPPSRRDLSCCGCS